MKFLDFGVEVVKGRAQTPGQVVALGQKGVPLGPEDAQIEFAVEERDFEAVAGRGVTMRLRNAMDQVCLPETSNGLPSCGFRKFWRINSGNSDHLAVRYSGQLI